MSPKIYLGIDIGGTKIAGALVSDAGRVVQRQDIPTEARQGGSHVLARAIELAKGLLSTTSDIAAIGVGAGGQIDSDRGVVVSASEILPGWTGTSIKADFERDFGLLTYVDNDVNALASGEIKFGAAKGLKTVVFLALGTGVGGAVVIEGKIHRGAHWAGGELGHLLLTMDRNARLDPGGSRGTLEAYCSGAGLVLTWREITGISSADISALQLAQEATRDASGNAALAGRKTGEYLGYGLTSLIDIIDPEMIVIGGGLSGWGDILLEPAREVVRNHALRECPIALATLGTDSSVIGAASLAII